MNARLPDTPRPWVDPDDAPELTDEFFEKGTWRVGERVVSKEEGLAAMRQQARGRPRAEVKRPMVSMRMDPDLLEHLRASGKGWQTKVNAILREAVQQGRV